MFFLKDLPTREMIEGLAGRFAGADADAMLDELRLLRRASLRLRLVENYLTAQGLSQTQFLVLTVILREPDRDSLTSVEIAERLDVSRPVLSKTLATMERKGLIARQPHGQDKRCVLIAPTEAGTQTYLALLPGYCDALLAPLPDDGASKDPTATG
ncbi:hypothetical protein JANAI62_00420 [Jannaschia pagri]|uniref:HTH marR-type domain-containing protein n=1 Tax=Jannaschia pagri TaxID=2829797 RepID=A0ABQ4NGU2_9RHOB|nr:MULTISPECIES: MarR family transcriptional regulator [unclassified Jannaschia]GIT90476.1 hypothetical protein JANAI61_09340 [Jannaschia sp. AI_61]GIT93419.1 hypothetical protein JANAI62_00420 [Jannaschia sp. AI_62]